MTDTITAADLAAALREAVKVQRWDAGECRECYGSGEYWDEEQDREVSCPQCKGTGISGDAAPRWKALLDRYDAQERKRLDWNIIISTNLQRQNMANARRVRAKYPKSREVSESVKRARTANHRILAFRRELRALGGDA